MDPLAIWEKGRALTWHGRALLLAEAALPGASRQELASLPLGQRDLAITGLRNALFGGEIRGRAACPGCGEPAEVTFKLDDIDAAGGSAGTQTLETEAVRFRLPDTLDVHAAAQAGGSVDAARRILAERCIEEGNAVTGETVNKVSARMGELDPRADLRLSLDCPACGQRWEVLFDIVRFAWREIEAAASRLLIEVHELARAYGWRESEILAMSDLRRKAYLEMVRA